MIFLLAISSCFALHVCWFGNLRDFFCLPFRLFRLFRPDGIWFLDKLIWTMADFIDDNNYDRLRKLSHLSKKWKINQPLFYPIRFERTEIGVYDLFPKFNSVASRFCLNETCFCFDGAVEFEHIKGSSSIWNWCWDLRAGQNCFAHAPYAIRQLVCSFWILFFFSLFSVVVSFGL